MNSTARIASLNDTFRSTLTFGGKAYLTASVAALGRAAITDITALVRGHSEFDAGEGGNDPYGEHDFGSFQYEGTTFFWKIDYYDNDLIHGSEDPSDPTITKRILTIMLASDY